MSGSATEHRLGEIHTQAIWCFHLVGRLFNQMVLTILGISGERIWVEMKKILQGQHVSDIMKVMFELGVAQYVGKHFISQ